MSKFFIQTFGCRCNQADSAAIRSGFCHSSMEEAETHRDADLIIINSCTVTHRSDQQVRQMVRRLHRENPGASLVVTGCYAERAPGDLAAISGVRLVVGNADKERLVELVQEEKVHPWGHVIRSPLDASRDYLVPPMSQTGGKTRPYIKIQDGCDARCSYCIIPKVRGPGRSARPEDILDEIRRLVGSGFLEIVLTGVHLGTYGRRLPDRPSLVELLRKILDIPGLGRLRLSSIEPMRFSRKIVDLASSSPAFARHFHIPLQSGSDRMLRRMRRPYSAGQFLSLMGYIDERLPGAGIGTDVIVGFPGETESDFEATCEVVRRSALTYLHVFPFSAREGTDAFSMKDRVPDRVVHERSRILRQISLEKNVAFRRRFLGETVPALTLAREEDMGEAAVLTDNYIHARASGSPTPSNRLVRVRIDEVGPDTTLCTIID